MSSYYFEFPEEFMEKELVICITSLVEGTYIHRVYFAEHVRTYGTVFKGGEIWINRPVWIDRWVAGWLTGQESGSLCLYLCLYYVYQWKTPKYILHITQMKSDLEENNFHAHL